MAKSTTTPRTRKAATPSKAKQTASKAKESTPRPDDEGLRVVELEATNVKRLSAVTIRPDGNAIVIGGQNAAGKSSVLDSIMYTLGGAKVCPEKPIRDGESYAEVKLHLGDYIVTRTWGEKGSQVEVTSPDGAAYKTPQAMLDGFVGEISFDPHEFERWNPKQQQEELRKLLGVDTEPLDVRRKQAFDNRTDENREVKRLNAAIESMQVDEEVEAVDVGELTDELGKADKHNNKATELRENMLALGRQVDHAESQHQHAVDAVSECDVRIAKLEQQLADEHLSRTDLQSAVDEQLGEVGRFQKQHNKAFAELSEFEKVDTAPILAQIKSANDVNRAVVHREARDELVRELTTAEQRAEALTNDIKAIDEKKRAMLSDVDFPVDGLGFGDGVVTYNDVPFSQCSSAERTRVSVAIGMALNPKLKVLLIRDGSLLDDCNLALIAEMAKERGYQVWIERVGEGDECSVIIEDGHVKDWGGDDGQ